MPKAKPKKEVAKPSKNEIPVVSKGSCKGCNHDIKLHYGSEKKWCNSNSCQCQALS